MEKIKILEEVCSEYKLSDMERNRIGNKINEIMLEEKRPSEHPISIIDIAPPGSGKTGLNGYACAQFKDNNVVIINSDELKPFLTQSATPANFRRFQEHQLEEIFYNRIKSWREREKGQKENLELNTEEGDR